MGSLCVVAAIRVVLAAVAMSGAAAQDSRGLRRTGNTVSPATKPAAATQIEDSRRLIQAPPRPIPTDEAVIALMRKANQDRESRTSSVEVVMELGKLESADVEWALVSLMRYYDQRTADAANQQLMRRDPVKARGPLLWALNDLQPQGWAKAIPEPDRAAWAAVGLSRIDAPEQGPPMEQLVGNGTVAVVKGPDRGAKEVYASVPTKHAVLAVTGERLTVVRHHVVVNRYDSRGRLEWGKITVVTPLGYVITGHSEKPVTTRQAMQLLKLAGGLETNYRRNFASIGTLYPVPAQEDQRFIRMALGIVSSGPDGKQVVAAWQQAHPNLAPASDRASP